MVSRRALVCGTASLALAGIMGLTGCEGGSDGLEGKTLYCVPAWNPEKMQSVTFLGGENCRYVGEQELSGTWSKDDDAVVIAFPDYESMTLKKAEGEESYTQSGWEDLGERYFPTEEEAIEYRDEFLAGCDERVAELLESTTWRLDVDDRVRKAEETITFKDGKGTFTKGEYDKSLRFNEVPDDDAWIARDHSGEYTVEVDLFTASRIGSSMAPRYAGTLVLGGDPVPFALHIYKNSPSIELDATIRFTDVKAFQE